MDYKRLLNSFKDAFKGIRYVYAHEQNFRIQIFVSFLLIFLIFLFNLSRGETVVILFLIVLVLILELLNSAIEKFLDILKPRMHLQVALVKDIMAAVVLFASIFSIIIGGIVFAPHLLRLFSL